MEELELLFGYIEKEDVNSVKKLLEKGVNPNSQDKYGYTPLMVATYYNQPDIVRILMEKGSNLKTQNYNGITALMDASMKCRIEIVNEMLKYADPKVVNIKSGEGYSALMAGARGGCTKVVEYLIKNGAEVNMQDSDGWTPLHEATSKGFVDIVSLLIRYGADLNIRDSEGYTPLGIATEWYKGDLAIKEQLKEVITTLKEFGGSL
ncbi:ankyrin repeat domain-containing protein [Salinithrix halophila]|uniref:ankyrin repeat domain-containing protein n=1 Tax=Salinithrix halophila TaxID=1485204 RepID=UPI0036D32AE2